MRICDWSSVVCFSDVHFLADSFRSHAVMHCVRLLPLAFDLDGGLPRTHPMRSTGGVMKNMGVMERVSTRKGKSATKQAAAIHADRLLRGDCISAMASLPDACVDMIFSDPHSNLQLGGDMFPPQGWRCDAVSTGLDKS